MDLGKIIISTGEIESQRAGIVIKVEFFQSFNIILLFKLKNQNIFLNFSNDYFYQYNKKKTFINKCCLFGNKSNESEKNILFVKSQQRLNNIFFNFQITFYRPQIIKDS